jgi:hypothetical protein
VISRTIVREGRLARASLLIGMLAMLIAGVAEPLVHALESSSPPVAAAGPTSSERGGPAPPSEPAPHDGWCVACQILAGIEPPVANPAFATVRFSWTEPAPPSRRLASEPDLGGTALPRAPPSRDPGAPRA